MKITFETQIIIPASANRKNVTACIFDTKSGEYKFLPTAKCTKEQIDELSNKKGTLLFIHKKYNIYGILKDVANRNKPLIQFYRQTDIENKSDTILNFNEQELIEDISNVRIDDIRKITEDDNRFYSIQLFSYLILTE